MATVVPPRPAELDIHKQQEAAAAQGARQPTGLVSLGSTSSAGGGRVKRKERSAMGRWLAPLDWRAVA